MPMKTTKFDVADFVKNPEVATEYLRVAIEDGDPVEIRQALKDIARAQGITNLARKTGLSREALYKALGENGNPTLTTLLAIFKALGLKMSVAA
jgi:probable addiction module antidote protein